MNAVAEPVALPRSRNDWTSPAELRALLKQNLRLNARQVTASKGHSNTWLTLTIRDPLVDVAAVKAFAAPFNTSHTDQTDYHSGQSVEVTTTKEVDAVHAAPFVEEIKRAVALLKEENAKTENHGCATKLANDKWLHRSNERGGDYYVTRDLNGGARGCYIWGSDVDAGTDWAIASLALQAARV